MGDILAGPDVYTALTTQQNTLNSSTNIAQRSLNMSNWYNATPPDINTTNWLNADDWYTYYTQTISNWGNISNSSCIHGIVVIPEFSSYGVGLGITLVFGMVVLLGVTIVGGLGNFLTILTIIHQMMLPKSYRNLLSMTPGRVLILNLALADLCYCVVCLPILFSTYYIIYTSGNLNQPLVEDPCNSVCEVAAFIRYATAIVERGTILLMAIERLVTIRRYSRCKGDIPWLTPARMAYCCPLLWVVGAALQLPTALELHPYFGKFGYNNMTMKCDFTYGNNGADGTFGARMMFFLLQALTPCLFILFCYAAIIVQIHISSRFTASFGTTHSRLAVAMRRSRTTAVFIKLISIYLVCVIPMCIWNLAIKEENLGQTHNRISGIAIYSIYWLQYCVNNFIYVIIYQNYRSAFWQLLSKLTCREVKPPVGHHYDTFSNKKKVPKVDVYHVQLNRTNCVGK